MNAHFFQKLSNLCLFRHPKVGLDLFWKIFYISNENFITFLFIPTPNIQIWYCTPPAVAIKRLNCNQKLRSGLMNNESHKHAPGSLAAQCIVWLSTTTFPLLPAVNGEQWETSQRLSKNPCKSFLEWPVSQGQQQIDDSKSVILLHRVMNFFLTQQNFLNPGKWCSSLKFHLVSKITFYVRGKKLTTMAVQ